METKIDKPRRCVLLFLLPALVLTCGCTRLPPPGKQPQVGTGREAAGLEAVAATLRRGSDLPMCRGVLQQLNADLARYPELKPAGLTEAEQRFLHEPFAGAADEINEIGSSAFTLLDGHYLEQCFLLRDAAQSLRSAGGKPETQAQAAFAWTVRQVRLGDENSDPIPPGPVLRRGWGSDRDRAVTFLALLDQLDIPGCMVAVPGASAPRYLLPGALVGGEVWLFDTRLGVPLPGPEGVGIATLAQLRRQPDLLQQLTPYNYDVTPDQVQRMEVYLPCPLSALAPRMRLLQQLLAASSIRLSQDPQQRLQAMRQAVQGLPGKPMEVRFWNAQGDWTAPSRLLRSFLPPEEGGADPTRNRQKQFDLSLTSMAALPKQVQDIPETIDLGARLRDQFEQRFIEFVTQAGKPRDLMLRGRFDEAVRHLIQTRDDVQQYRTALRQEPELEKTFNVWCVEALKAQQEVLVARRQAENQRTDETQAALTEAQERMAGVWKKWPSGPRMFLFRASLEPVAVECAYLLALAKHEQAELGQLQLPAEAERRAEQIEAARSAWLAASEWWQKYLEESPAGPASVAARLNRARALDMLGERNAAVAVLEAANAQGWNKSAVQYRIDRLKAR